MRGWLRFRGRALAVVLGLTLTVVGCGGGDEPGEATAQETSTTSLAPTTTGAPRTTAVPSTPTTAPASALIDHPLDFGALGPIHVGMTLEEAQAASGTELREDQLYPDIDCVYWFPSEETGVWFLAVGGRLAVISVPVANTTSQGIGAGARPQDVINAYGAQYVEERTNRFRVKELVVTSTDPRFAELGIVFSLGSAEARSVETIRTGLVNELDRDEGCA